MADIFSGKGLTLQYNTDTGNRSPQGIGNVTINNVTEFPALTIQSETNNFETYDNEYKTVLLSDKSVEPFDIVVSYLPDDPTHQFLDEMAESQSVFQVILQYQLDLEESQITYAIVNGYVTGTQLSGDKDQVVTKSYSFTPADVVARVMTMAALLPVYQGDYGVGANTTGIPQYAPVTPTGNSFIKVPSTQAGNPSGADMMGIGLVDGSSVAEFAMTKTGTLSLFAKNATTAWTRIYTATQMDARYVQLTRTINGKALTADITLTSTDTGSVPVERTVNGHELSDDVVLTKQDIQLENVTNDAQLKISSNLADIDDSEIARTNLDVYSKEQIDSNIDEVNNSINILTAHINTDFVPKTITVNGHALSSNVTVTKSDVGLSNVTNDAQLKIASNLADLNNIVTSRTNLGLGSLAVQNANAVAITGGQATLSTLTLSTALPLTSGGTGATTAAAARTNLGLGTAATVNVGTSGGTVPLLNATNTWSGTQIFASTIQGNVSGTASNVTGIVSIDNGGTGAVTASEARSNLELGAAAVRDTLSPTGKLLAVGDFGISISTTEGSVIPDWGTVNNSNLPLPTGIYDGICQNWSSPQDAGATQRLRFLNLSSDPKWGVQIGGVDSPEKGAGFYVRSLSSGSYTAWDKVLTSYNAGWSVITPADGPVADNSTLLKTGLYYSTVDKVGSPIGGSGGCSVIQLNGNSNSYRCQLVSQDGNGGRFFIRSTAIGVWGTYKEFTTSSVSDARSKNIGEPLDLNIALDNISRMDFVNFTFKSDEDETPRRGVVSQQIMDIDPQYVKEVGDLYHLDETPMMLDGLAAIKALKQMNDDLSTEIENLKALVQSLIDNK
ncbi:tail fiber domain-containing protein [Scandinavium manionii]|uniref:tail fiber domain-containing protein n=1 Tax=Scandinavium manionii TaxID=2926520 RepID=UPI002165B0FE|nr:tail fiber domain-containing protein [Scandinavium manionii]MCS2164595.1 tail fiber domain-containing protein [Scandinavium manionii]